MTGVGEVHRAPRNRHPHRQTLVDHLGQLRFAEHPPVVLDRSRLGNAQHPPAGRVDDSDLAVQPHHQQACREAFDDLAVQPLRGLGARGGGAFLGLELFERLLQRRRQQGRLAGSLAMRATRVAGRCADPQHREGQRGSEHADDRRQPQQNVRVGIHVWATTGAGTSRAAAIRQLRPAPRRRRGTCRMAAPSSCRRAGRGSSRRR